MRIVKLEAENVKRLRAIEIEPDGNVVVISGKNGQGKSSLLDAIFLALGGSAAAKTTPQPVREGEQSARVQLDMGEVVVTRTWVADGRTTLKVTNAAGSSFASPQAMLDGLVGKLSFDPLAFSRQDDKEQLKTLLGLVELPFDPAVVEESRKEIFEERTEVNREVKSLLARLEALVEERGRPADDVPTEEVSTADLLAEYREAQDADRAVDAAAAEIEQAILHRTNCAEEIDRLVAELDAARTAHEASKTAFDAVLAKHPTLDRPDLADIEKRLAGAEELNQQVRSARDFFDLRTRLIASEDQAEALTAKLGEIDKVKADGVAAATMPIDGLAFDDNGVTYNGIAFKQASAAEQLRVSLAMAMAMNPTIRVIRITDGSLLDESNLELINKMAADGDMQVWIERVSDTGDVGVVIDDGSRVDA